MAITNPFQDLADRLQRIESIVTALKSDPNKTRDNLEDLPITIKEAASLVKLAVPTIYNLVHRRKIPSYRRGKRLYFLKSELLAWIKAGRQPTIEETKEDAQKSLID